MTQKITKKKAARLVSSLAPPDNGDETSRSRFIKNLEALALVLGLKLYDQRLQRQAQLASVKALSERQDFPARARGLWPRASVADWAKANLKVSKDKRHLTPSLSPSAAEKGSKARLAGTLALPVQDVPAADGELFLHDEALSSGIVDELRLEEWQVASIRKYPFGFQRRLIGLYRKWLSPDDKEERALTGQEKAELIKCGVVREVLADAPSGEALISQNIEGGFRGVANWVRNNFHGRLSRVPSHTDIQNWNKGDHLPAGCRENFPNSSGLNGRYKSAAVSAWVEKYLLKAGSAQDLNLPVNYRDAQEKLDYERAEQEFELWKRANSDKFVESAIADGVLTGFGTWVGGNLDSHNEDRHGIRRLFLKAVTELVRAAPAIIEAGKTGFVIWDVDKFCTILDTRIAGELRSANEAMKTAIGLQAAEMIEQMLKNRQEQIAKSQAAT